MYKRIVFNKAANSQYGFTLLEIMLVLLLMGGILMTITPHFISESNQVRKRVNQANVLKIEGAAQLFRIDVGIYPLSVTELLFSPGVSGWRGPYLEEIPINPYDSALGYQIDAWGHVK